jgi:hypothetical protein
MSMHVHIIQCLLLRSIQLLLGLARMHLSLCENYIMLCRDRSKLLQTLVLHKSEIQVVIGVHNATGESALRLALDAVQGRDPVLLFGQPLRTAL